MRVPTAVPGEGKPDGGALMDLHHLKTFATVAREGSLTRSAQILLLSQPAVSGHIKLLEEELGTMLFERTAKGMQLTRAGLILLEEAERTLDAAKTLVNRARGLQGDAAGPLALGIASDPAALRLGTLLSTLLASHPRLRLRVSHHLSADVVDRVQDGRLDAGFVPEERPDRALRHLPVAPVAPVRLRVVGPAAWRDRLAGADWGDLAALPWVGTPPRCSFHLIAARAFARNGVAPGTIIKVDQESALKGLVTEGLGLALLREEQALAAAAAGEVALWPGEALRSHLHLILPLDKEGEPALQALRAAVGAVWQEPQRQDPP
ncbi:LysR family transcriptional regulator [Azospirillum sp. Marseille-Q6669]